jgi:hypothetical protein
MEITKLIQALLEMFFVHTKRNTECSRIFEFDTAETKFTVRITAS